MLCAGWCRTARGALYEQSQVSRRKWLTVPDPIGSHLHDPADVAAVAVLVIGCHERDLAFHLVLTADLTVQRLLVGSSLLFEKASPSLKASPTASGGSRPPAPAAVAERFLGV